MWGEILTRALFYLSKNLGGVTHFVFGRHPHAQVGIVGVKDIPAVARRSHPAVNDKSGLSLDVDGIIEPGAHVNILADPGYGPEGAGFSSCKRSLRVLPSGLV